MKRSAAIGAIIIACAWLFAGCDITGVKRLEDGTRLYTGDGKKLSGKSAVEGLVIDGVTRKGIAGARVEMKNANMGVGYYTCDTDRSGRFIIEDFIPYIKYVVDVSAPGYVTSTSTGGPLQKVNTPMSSSRRPYFPV